jgi:hypothetical protein
MLRVAFSISSDREIEGFYSVVGNEITLTAGGTVMKRKLADGEAAEKVALNELIVRQLDRG